MFELPSSLVHAACLDEYALKVADKPRDDFLTSEVTRGNALHRTADLVQSDIPMTSPRKALDHDLQSYKERSPDDVTFEDAVGEHLERYVEAIKIFCDLQESPVVVVLPSPYALLSELYGGVWIQFLESGDLAAFDLLHDAGQFLGDLMRHLGQRGVSGFLIDDRPLPSFEDRPERFEDVFIEYGTLFNIAEHFDCPLFGIYQPDCLLVHASPGERYHHLIADTPEPLQSLERFSSLPDGQTIPEKFWEYSDEDEFISRAREWLGNLCEQRPYLLYSEIPRTVVPEHVQQFIDLLEAFHG